jgi:transcriptional regulator with XRE-family HTH domain
MQLTSKCATYIRSTAIAMQYRNQVALARAVGCSPSMLSRVLNGSRRASSNLVARLEATLHLKPGSIRRKQ